MKTVRGKIYCKKRYIVFMVTLVIFKGFAKNSKEFMILEEPTINRVTLTGGPWYEAMEQERNYLHFLDADRLLVHFRKVAGIPSFAEEYGGWESKSSELRGHSMGHYLSAASRMSVLCDDNLLRERCKYIVHELRNCQEKNGEGYLSAFPSEYLDRVENIQKVWAPYYTLHKILAGLFDCYKYLNDKIALQTALDLTHYLYKRILPLGEEHFQKVLDHTEQGGMIEVLWDLYNASSDPVCRNLAYAFYQHSYFDPLTEKKDNLKGYHANSFIPTVVGIARQYEISHNIGDCQIAEFFWEQLVKARSFVTGGTGNGEHWNSDPHHLHLELGPSAHECCCTYNMIKLSAHLWKWSKDIKYQEYIERALTNGILPTQNKETGMSMYYVSMAPGYYKTWGTPESSFWCCTGTGMENFSRIAEYIYDEGNEWLYINQFVPSKLVCSEKGFTLFQSTDLPKGENVELTIESEGPISLKLAVRIPGWSGSDYQVFLNEKELKSKPSPGSYLLIERVWNSGDRLKIVFTPLLWHSLLPVTNDYIAFGCGPIVLSGRFQEADIKEELRHRYGPYDSNPIKVFPIQVDAENIEDQLEVVDKHRRWYRIRNIEGDYIDLVPFYDIHMEYFAIYLPLGE